MGEHRRTAEAAGRQLPAARLLVVGLSEQAADLRRTVGAVRTADPGGLPEAVHDLRVACREMRSVLATFRPVFDADVTDPVRDQLAWLAGSLAEARDVHVAGDRLRQLLRVAKDGGDAVADEARLRIERTYATESVAATGAAWAAVESDRCVALLAGVRSLAAQPPLTELAHLPAVQVLPQQVWKEWRRLKRRAHRLDTNTPDGPQDEVLHDVRKAAKRVRYAVAVVEPDFRTQATPLAKAAKRLTQVLGEHQDTVVSRRQLAALVEAARAAGESEAPYAAFRAREEAHAAELTRKFLRVWHSVDREDLGWWRDAGRRLEPDGQPADGKPGRASS